MPSIHAPTRAVLLLLVAGCAAPPPPQLPPGRIFVDAFWGTPLTGDQAGTPTSEATGAAPAVQCELRYVRARDLPALTPLASNTRLVAGLAGRQPLHASLAAIAGGGFASGAAGVQTLSEVLARGEGHDLGSLDGAVPAGVTLSFDVQTAAPLLPSSAARGAIAFQVWQPAGADAELGVAILVTDLTDAAPPELEVAADAAAAAPELRRRLTLLERGLARDGTPLALAVPSPFAGEQDRALVAVLRATPGAPAHAVDRARAVADAAGALAAQRRAPADASIERRALERAWGALGQPARRRAALDALARAGGAALAADLALAADDVTLAAFVDTLPPGPLPAASGWVLERTACTFVTRQLDRDEAAPELLAMLVRRAGEAGPAPGVLADVLARCANLDDLATELVAENLVFLHDTDPSARVRAFEWLAARGRAPAGFAPLAERGARRAALQAAAENAEADR